MPEIREERRIVTALFADIVGSTALAERHDPEEARLIVGEAITRAVRIVEAYGGTVKDLAGDGMLALFGAPVAHEDDPERALRAALEIAGAVTEYAEDVRRGWGVDGFGVRLGVETGEVVVGEVGAGSRTEYGATGDAVNVAARLQAEAPPGGILVGPRTRRLAADLFVWGDQRQLVLKGKAEPVEAAPVTAVRESAQRQALAPLTGRDGEMQQLRETLDALESGRGGIVFLTGEPGIGKSRLTAETRALAGQARTTWLEGRSVSYGAALAWWPVRDLLRGWIGVGTQEPELRVRLALRRKLEEVAPGQAAAMAPYLGSVLGLAPDPAGAADLASLSAEAVQFQTYEVLTELVAALARFAPLVIAIDDLHWSDATTLGLCERLLPLTESLPLLLFFNHRPDTAHSSWALREKATRDYRHVVTALDLRPLEAEAERALLRSLAEGALTPDAEAGVIERADGNPLYLEELARALGEGGIVRSLPATLEGVVLARLDSLEPAWRDLVTAASACGRTFSIGLLVAVTDTPEAELRPVLHNLLRLDLLNEERRWPESSYRFKHALIQEAAYRTLVKARRQDLHARAARWLEQRYADSPERVYGLLAHHWQEAADNAQAATYLGLAGRQALREWSLDEAADDFKALVRVLRDGGRDHEAAGPLFQLAYTLHLAMRFAEANDAWQEATRLWQEPPPATKPQTATLVVGGTRVPWDADTFHGYYSVNLRLTQQLEDGLFVLREGPSVEPHLARRLEVSGDGLRYRIHLKPGLTFNSGRSFNAASVVESFRECFRRSADATMLWMIAGAERLSRTGDASELGVEAIDDLTVELRLLRPYPALHQALTYPQYGGALPGDWTGPYRLVEMTEERVVAEVDPGYPRAILGNVRRIEWTPVKPLDPKPELEADAVDVIGQGVVAIPEGIRTQAAEIAGPAAFLVGLWPTNHGLPVDAALRRALALATDRERLQPLLARHQFIAAGGVVPPGLPGHTPGIAPAFDPDAARRALAESSHRGPLHVAYYQEWPQPALMETLETWRDVLGLQVDAQGGSVMNNTEDAKRVHVIQMNWIAAVPDPSYYLHELLHGGSRSNLAGTADPGLDDLLDRAQAEVDGSARLALYHEADRYCVADRNLFIPILYMQGVAIVQPWVQGWWEWANPNQRVSELTVLPASPRYRPT